MQVNSITTKRLILLYHAYGIYVVAGFPSVDSRKLIIQITESVESVESVESAEYAESAWFAEFDESV